MSTNEKSLLNNKSKEREFILECIKIYETLPALWNVKSEEYTNRRKKNVAYDVLVNKYRKGFPGATREDVTKKFNSLRTNYRKELKRINDAKRDDGTAMEESTLWYFNEMNFLADQGIIRNSINVIKKSKEENNSTNNITQVNNENIITIKKETLEQIKQPPKKKKKKNVQDELMNLAYNRLKQTSESEYDKIAKTWAIELQKLSPEQQIYAKKAINDILYEGQLGNLYRNCVQIADTTNNHFSTVLNNSRSTINSVESYQEASSQHSQYLKEPFICSARRMSV